MNEKWTIVADSSCDLHSLPETEESNISFVTVPFLISIDSVEYTDDLGLDTDEMLSRNESSSARGRTACPAPQAFLEAFGSEGNVLVFTISSALSGSYQSACAAREMLRGVQPGREVRVIDTRATGPETVLLIRRALDLIRQGNTPADIEDALKSSALRTHIAFALSSYRNLIKAGRISRLKAFFADKLGFWGVGVGSDEGEIRMRGKAQGLKRTISLLIDEIKRNGLSCGSLVICHCMNEDGARLLKQKLEAAFGHIRIDILPTRGLDSYYAERHGLILAY